MTDKDTKKSQKSEKIVLREDASQKLQRWLAQLENAHPGLSLSKADMLQWVVLRQPDQLRSRDLIEIKEKYFDEIKQLKWAMRQLKSARQRGEKIVLHDLLGNQRTRTISSPAQSKRGSHKVKEIDFAPAGEADE